MLAYKKKNSTKKKELIGWALASPLHVANFMAYYYSNLEYYDRATIYLYEYWGRSILSDRYIDFLNQSNITLKAAHDSASLNDIKKVSKKSDIVFVGRFNWRVILKTNKNIQKLILIDEGLSSYRSRTSLSKTDSNFKFFKYLTSSMLINISILLKKKQKINFRTFQNRSTLINESYKQGIFKYFNDMKLFNYLGNNKNYQNSILYCSQPWVELGNISEEDHIDNILKLKSSVESKGYSFVIKKHPAETIVNYEKYGINILDDGRMLEEIFYSTPFKAIVSKNSTSSLLLPALYKVDSYLLSLSETKGLGPYAERLFSYYCNNFEDLI